MALSVIEPELLPSKVLHCGNRKFCVFSEQWGIDLLFAHIALRKGRKGRNTKVNMWREVRNINTPVKFNVDRYRGFSIPGVQSRSAPLTRRVTLTTVLHYGEPTVREIRNPK